MNEEISVRTLRSVSEIEEIRGIWTSWQHHPNVDIDFYLTVSRSRPQILRPHVIVVDRGGLPAAMLIGRLVDGRIDIKIGYASFFRPQARLLAFAYGGLLGNSSSENCELLIGEISNSLRRGEADVALLSNVRVRTPLFDLATRMPCFLTRDHLPVPQAHWTLSLPGSIEEIYRAMPEHHRSEIRRKVKKFIANYPGRVCINRFCDPAELDRMIEDMEEVAKKTYQRGLGVGFIDSVEMRNQLHLAAQKGWLRAYILYVAERPCAFWMGSRYGETFQGNFAAYDPAYGKYSPGMFLTMRVIEELCQSNGQERVREIDFGFGDAEYKTLLGNCRWEEASVYIFAPTLKGVRLNVLRTSALLIDRALRKGAERTNLLPKIKRIWRDHVSPKQG
jgi:hypothetical protein